MGLYISSPLLSPWISAFRWLLHLDSLEREVCWAFLFGVHCYSTVYAIVTWTTNLLYSSATAQAEKFLNSKRFVCCAKPSYTRTFQRDLQTRHILEMSATAVEIHTSPVTFPLSLAHRMDTIRVAAEMKWSSSWPTDAQGLPAKKLQHVKRDALPKVLLSPERKVKQGTKIQSKLQETKEKTTSEKAPEASPSDDQAWGPIFQNREHFVEMHIC